MRIQRVRFVCSAVAVCLAGLTLGLSLPAQTQGPVRITLDEAIQLALQHNHSLHAARTTILQNQAQEITANLRPNPTLSATRSSCRSFSRKISIRTTSTTTRSSTSASATCSSAARKRQHRLQAAKDQTAVTTATVDDNERTLTFNVASQFIGVLLAESTLDLAEQDLESFQKTVDISQARYDAGDMSEGDLLKIKLQLLQFQMDVSPAELAKVQALARLRQLLGYRIRPGGFRRVG